MNRSVSLYQNFPENFERWDICQPEIFLNEKMPKNLCMVQTNNVLLLEKNSLPEWIVVKMVEQVEL